MATNKKRLNITLSPEMEKVIERLAKRDKLPQSRKVVELLRSALAIEEDRVWDRLAQERDTHDASFLSHTKAWM